MGFVRVGMEAIDSSSLGWVANSEAMETGASAAGSEANDVAIVVGGAGGY